MKTARAEFTPIRQRTQYSCMAASMKMALEAQGMETDEDTVNRVMGAKPMQGASWEQALACAQHFGMRATLITPCPMSTLKEWTDRGVAVMIAWNPEGREWSHASVVFDVDGKTVSVADPNIPDPEQTVREVPRDEFLKKWFEKWPNYLVRRPALAIEREITKDGRQVMASTASVSRIAARYLEARVEIRTFDTGDWHAYSGAEAFEDGEPLIADINSIENGYGGFRVRGDVFTSVTFTVDAQGGQAHFSNAKGHEAIAIDHKNIRFQRDGKKFLKYTLDTFHATGTLPPMYKFV